MKSKKYHNQFCLIVLHVLVGISLVWGCAKMVPLKGEIPTEPITLEMIQAQKMLGAAEHFIQAGEYQKALRAYDDYLSESPPRPFADRVLMQKGNLYMVLGDYPSARRAYQVLIFDYPRSSFADEAKINIPFTYYKERNYREAILYAKSLLSLKSLAIRQRIRLMTLIGDSFLEQQNAYDAVISYMDVYRLAQGEAREDSLEKIKLAISGLAEPEARILIQQWGKDRLSGYLLLQLAELYAQQGRETDALEILSGLLKDFPKHELTGAATEFTLRLKKSLDIDKWAIGCILPLTGPYEQFGNCVLAGIELALAEFNSASVGTPVRIVIKDSRGDPEVAARALEYLVHDEKVIGIIGPMTTAEYVAESAHNLGIPIITLTQKEDITKIGDFVFRDFLTPLQQIKTLVPYVVNTLGYKKLAIIYPDDTSGIRFMNLFWDKLIEQGGRVVGVESYNSNQTDFATPIKKLIGLYYERVEPIKVTEEEITGVGETIEEEIADEEVEAEADEEVEAEADEEVEAEADEEVETEEPEEPEPIIDFDAIFIPDTSKSVSLIAPQLLYNDVTDILLIGTNLWYSPRLLRQSAGYVQGAIFSTGFFVEDANPVVQKFVAKFQDTFGRTPIFFDAQGYDIAKLLFHVVQQPTVCTRKGLQVALHHVSGFPTVTGFISFDETGDARKELVLLKVRGKRFVQIR